MTRAEERRRPVGEDDLQAFVDGRLTAVRLEVVEAYLAAHPERAAALAAQQDQRAALRAALAWKAEEPIPARLRPDRLREARRRAARRGFALAASVAGALLVGVGGGWFGRDLLDAVGPGAANEAVARERSALAASAHRVYAADAFRPVEIHATAGDLIVRWLTNRLGQPVEAPDLAPLGLRFLGGRLIPTREGAAGQLMYDDEAGVRVTLFLLPAAAARAGGIGATPRFETLEGVGTLAWADARFVYVAVAAAPRARLEAVAAAVRGAMAPAAAVRG